MSDSETGQDDAGEQRPRRSRRNADPQVFTSRQGSRLYSVQALLERIRAQFISEYGANSAALREADTSSKRLKLILGTVDYILAVESIQLTAEEKAALMRTVYSNLFGYGPLDALFADEQVTTISLDGADKASIRNGHGGLEALDPLFEDEAELRDIIGRLVADAGAELNSQQPYMEVGLTVGERPVCVNLIMPPVTFHLTADIRLHPRTLPTIEALIEQGFMTAEAATLLKALAASPHGVVIVGDTEAGKTTLLSLLAGWLPQPENAVAVERAGELRLPEGVERLITKWPVGDDPGVTFGAQIAAALESGKSSLLLDEVLSDEPEMIAPLLQVENAPRQIWNFRGQPDVKRLRSALSMLARRADMGMGEAMVQALYARLPFVVTLRRAQQEGRLLLRGIGEWQAQDGSDYPDFVLLMERTDDMLELMGKRSQRELILPAGFWG